MSEANVTVVRRTDYGTLIRHHLSNGWFIDGAKCISQYTQGEKYGVYIPGAHPSGCALMIAPARTLKIALASVNNVVVAKAGAQ